MVKNGKCKAGYYYCYTDEKCKPIPKGFKVVGRAGYLRKENGHSVDDENTNGNGNGNGNGHSNGNGNGGNGGGMSESKSGDSSLRDWFGKSKSSDGKPGWVQLGGKYAGKPCARQPGQTTKPKCGSSKMKRNLSKDEEERAFRRKNAKDPNPDRKGKAINVKTEETVNEGKKDACYHKVKSRYSVWPSAYASGALVKCRKVGAANWGNKTKKEEYQFSNWRDEFKATEIETTDLITAEEEMKVNEAKKCWPGYKKVGTQKLFGKTYNRCVKAGDEIQHDGEELEEAVQVPRKTGNIVMVYLTFRGKMYTIKIFFPSVKTPSRSEVQDQIDKVYPGGKVRHYQVTDYEPGEPVLHSEERGGDQAVEETAGSNATASGEISEESEGTSVEEGAAWTKKEGKAKSGGLNEKGRKSYERENPGSDLKRPSKKVGNPRRKSFCARMKGMKKKLTSSKTANDPDSRINKSLRAWNC